MKRLLVMAVVVLLSAGTSRVALAEDQPWATGVSEERKAAAQKSLEEGNALFLQKNYAEALAKYEAAVASWDHPAIRFNMVRCLIQLNQIVQASDNLALALKYGAAPMEEAVYTEALNYQTLLAGRIGDLEVSCDQAGAKISLDGKSLIAACPGKEKRRLEPGQHMVVGSKDGFLTKSVEVIVLGGQTKQTEVKLIPLGKAAKIVHKWPAWIPWTVFGGGIALAGFGAFMESQASSKMSAFDQSVSRECAVTGCPADDPTLAALEKDKSSAERLDKIAVSIIIVGGATAAAGGVMLFINRGKTVYEDTEKLPAAGTALHVLPRHDGGMLTLSGSF